MGRDTEKYMSELQKRENEIERALQYFGITKSEGQGGYYVAQNNKWMRDATGITAVSNSCEDGEKFRITTHYAPEYPLIITCVTKCQ